MEGGGHCHVGQGSWVLYAKVPGRPWHDFQGLPCGRAERTCLHMSAEAQPFTSWAQTAQFWKLSIGSEDFLRPTVVKMARLLRCLLFPYSWLLHLQRNKSKLYHWARFKTTSVCCNTAWANAFWGQCSQRVVSRLLATDAAAGRQLASCHALGISLWQALQTASETPSESLGSCSIQTSRASERSTSCHSHAL